MSLPWPTVAEQEAVQSIFGPSKEYEKQFDGVMARFYRMANLLEVADQLLGIVPPPQGIDTATWDLHVKQWRDLKAEVLK